MYEYTSGVFAVGLDGLAPVDDAKIGAMAQEGWEPVHMTTVHNGFAALVLFRREGGRAGRAAPKAAREAAKPSPTRARVRKVPVKATGTGKAAKASGKAAVGGTAARKSRRS